MAKSLEFLDDGVDIFNFGAGLPNRRVLDGNHFNSGAHIHAQLLGRCFLNGLLLGFLKSNTRFYLKSVQTIDVVKGEPTMMFGRVA